MLSHTFIFSPGTWKGEGKILLSMVDEELLFETNWGVHNQDFSGKVVCSQEIQVRGLTDHVKNILTFYNFQAKTFSVDMENDNIGKIVGTGVFDDKMIAWEFRGNDVNFEGFETYTLQEDGSYAMKGEYLTSDQFRTQIQARIWSESKEAPASDSDSDEDNNEEES